MLCLSVSQPELLPEGSKVQPPLSPGGGPEETLDIVNFFLGEGFFIVFGSCKDSKNLDMKYYGVDPNAIDQVNRLP